MIVTRKLILVTIARIMVANILVNGTFISDSIAQSLYMLSSILGIYIGLYCISNARNIRKIPDIKDRKLELLQFIAISTINAFACLVELFVLF